MEHAFGTRITLEDGRVVEVVERIEGCKGCAFDGYDTQCWHIKEKGFCSNFLRTDGKGIIYKEVK